jgi:cytochrome bd ubiquinol oxidase subunit II
MNTLSSFDYSVAFAVAEAFIIALYVVLDGFDLGVGILFPFAPRPADRDLMIETLAPVWDGNETWLVLGGMVLLGAFPGAFAILLPAYYVPLALMLFALVLRGISFEFRAQGGPLQVVWTVAFAGGSALAAFCQGAILGSFVGGGLHVVGGRFAGGPFDWLNLFSIITGLGVIAGYGLLGACWLIWKTDDDTQIFARELAFTTLLCTGAAIVVVSLWTAFSVPQIAERWFALPNLFLLAPLPLIALAAWIGVLRLLWGSRDWLPFLCAIPLFLASLGGLGASIWPQAAPGVMTIWEASSAHRTQVILSGALLGIVPIVLAYTAFSYWTFRGKIPAPEANT